MTTRDPVTIDPFDQNVIAITRTLLAWRGVSVEETAAAAEMGTNSLYQRLAPFTGNQGKTMSPIPFRARELKLLADFFRVDVSVFYRPSDDLIHGAQPPLEPRSANHPARVAKRAKAK